MGSARGMVEIVRRDDLVFNAFVVVLHAVLCIVALEHVQILHRELVILVPSNSKTFLVFVFKSF